MIDKIKYTSKELRDFEEQIKQEFLKGTIKGPCHLAGGDEDQLIEIFSKIKRTDWVLSTWRSSYHAILHGVPKEKVWEKIMEGKSINLCFPDYNFYTSAIVGGIIPIAVGLGYALKGTDNRVYCCIGDMAESCGMFHDSYKFVMINNLSVTFIVGNNFVSTNTPTLESWGLKPNPNRKVKTDVRYDNQWYWYYEYERVYPHVGIGFKVAMS